MAITVKHKFVSAIPDAGDPTIVQPSNWNDSHDLTGTVPVANGGTGASTATDGLNNLLPSQTGNNGKVLATDGTNATWTTNGSGDVVGPASATDNAVARFDTTTGKLIQNSGVTIDDNSNINANALDDGYLNTAASGTLITLTSASVRRYTITGSGGQTIKLPDATTLANGAVFQFDNNQSSGAITVNNNSNTLIVSVPSGGFVLVNLLSNATAAGSWDRHDQAPANVSWSTNTFDYAGSITSATWNGNAVAINRGGTGQATASAAFNALSPLTTAGDVLYGGTSGAGTRLGIGSAGQVLTVNAGATAPQWSTPTTGTVTAVSVNSANGFAGTSSGGATPALTLSTSITGVLKGNGTAISAATAGTDYSAGTSANNSGLVYSTTTTGALTTATGAQVATALGSTNITGSAANVTGVVLGANGGTGVANTGSTITVAGNLSHAGAFTQTFTATANTALTLPTSGTLISTVTNMAANPVTGTPSASNYLRGDGTWAAVTASAGGSNTQVQYNNAGALAGSANLTFDGTTLTGAFSGAHNGTVGATTPNTVVATQLTVNGSNLNTAISPTGTGTVTISPAGALTINPTAASTINNASIGATTASTGRFTSITATTGTITPATGTASVAPISLTAGTNLTTTTAGAIEYDGSSFYSSIAASTRGVMPTEQIVVLNTAYTLTSTTAAQKLFNNTTNGAVTLPIGTYQFECSFTVTSLSSTTGSFGFAFGGAATIGSQAWWVFASKPTAFTGSTTWQGNYNTAASTGLTTVGTATNGMAVIKGILKITAAGTVIPQISLSPAAAAIVGINSYFKISPITGASAANITVGNWS
jgi:hypothetical protein